jgi:hypothetical protein
LGRHGVRDGGVTGDDLEGLTAALGYVQHREQHWHDIPAGITGGIGGVGDRDPAGSGFTKTSIVAEREGGPATALLAYHV